MEKKKKWALRWKTSTSCCLNQAAGPHSQIYINPDTLGYISRFYCVWKLRSAAVLALCAHNYSWSFHCGVFHTVGVSLFFFFFSFRLFDLTARLAAYCSKGFFFSFPSSSSSPSSFFVSQLINSALYSDGELRL